TGVVHCAGWGAARMGGGTPGVGGGGAVVSAGAAVSVEAGAVVAEAVAVGVASGVEFAGRLLSMMQPVAKKRAKPRARQRVFMVWSSKRPRISHRPGASIVYFRSAKPEQKRGFLGHPPELWQSGVHDDRGKCALFGPGSHPRARRGRVRRESASGGR